MGVGVPIAVVTFPVWSPVVAAVYCAKKLRKHVERYTKMLQQVTAVIAATLDQHAATTQLQQQPAAATPYPPLLRRENSMSLAQLEAAAAPNTGSRQVEAAGMAAFKAAKLAAATFKSQLTAPTLLVFRLGGQHPGSRQRLAKLAGRAATACIMDANGHYFGLV